MTTVITIKEKDDGKYAVLIVGTSAWGVGYDFGRWAAAFDVAHAIYTGMLRDGADVTLDATEPAHAD